MNIARHILVLSIAAAALTACDTIKEDDRWLDIPAVEPDTPDTPDLPIPQLTVLLEEYTGQNCVNCSEAHTTLERLKEQYGPRLVTVSIHGGKYAWSDETYGALGLANSESMAYVKEAGVSSFPSGQVDRRTGILGMTEWSGVVRTEMARETTVALRLRPTLSDDAKTIDIAVDGGATAATSGKLLVWIVESDIIAPQIYPDGKSYNTTYVHNHVFRATVNGMAGDAVTVAQYTADDTDIYKNSWTYSIAVNPVWNTEHVSVVAFVYNADGVMQTIEAALGETAENISPSDDSKQE